MAVALVLAYTVFRPPSTPGPLERDFEAYYAAGATVNAGGDPYSRGIWSVERRIPGVNAEHDELLPYVGPAAALPLWSTLARLPYHAAAVVWTALLAAALAGIIAAAFRLSRAAHDGPTVAWTAAFTLASAPVVSALALGQAALVSAAGVAGALIAYRARRPAEAIGATLLAGIQPNLALALLGRLRTPWDIALAAAAGSAFAALTLAAGGGDRGVASYLRRLAAHGAAERDVAIQHTPSAIAYSFGLAPNVAAMLGSAAALAAVGALILCIVRERLNATSAALLTCALFPFAVPFFHEHDFVLELLPLLILALRARGRARALASVAAVLLLVDWFGFAQRTAAQGQIVCLGLAVVLGFAALQRPAGRGFPPEGWGLLVFACLAAIALPLGRLRPAPVWPDRLPVTFHADPATDASAVWAAEQRATGLTARIPAWGLLRGLPLAGCIVLSAALVAEARRLRVPTLRGDVRGTPDVRSGWSVAALARRIRRSRRRRAAARTGSSRA